MVGWQDEFFRKVSPRIIRYRKRKMQCSASFVFNDLQSSMMEAHLVERTYVGGCAGSARRTGQAGRSSERKGLMVFSIS